MAAWLRSTGAVKQAAAVKDLAARARDQALLLSRSAASDDPLKSARELPQQTSREPNSVVAPVDQIPAA
jgi:hypothetical protein